MGCRANLSEQPNIKPCGVSVPVDMFGGGGILQVTWQREVSMLAAGAEAGAAMFGFGMMSVM